MFAHWWELARSQIISLDIKASASISPIIQQPPRDCLFSDETRAIAPNKSPIITNTSEFDTLFVIPSIWCLLAPSEPLRTQPGQPHLVDLFTQKRFSCGSAGRFFSFLIFKREKFSQRKEMKIMICLYDVNEVAEASWRWWGLKQGALMQFRSANQIFSFQTFFPARSRSLCMAAWCCWRMQIACCLRAIGLQAAYWTVNTIDLLLSWTVLIEFNGNGEAMPWACSRKGDCNWFKSWRGGQNNEWEDDIVVWHRSRLIAQRKSPNLHI